MGVKHTCAGSSMKVPAPRPVIYEMPGRRSQPAWTLKDLTAFHTRSILCADGSVRVFLLVSGWVLRLLIFM